MKDDTRLDVFTTEIKSCEDCGMCDKDWGDEPACLNEDLKEEFCTIPTPLNEIWDKCPLPLNRKQHPRNPFLCVDIIFEIDNKVLLIERQNPPHGWALPGGYVDYGEAVEHAAIREAKEETSLNVTKLELLGVYSDPNRDPRSHNVSVVFIATEFSGTPKAGDDAKETGIWARDCLPELAFDHAQIVNDYFERKNK